MQISRRKLLGGLSAFIAAPAIIKVAGIMPVKVWKDVTYGPGYTLLRDSASPSAIDYLPGHIVLGSDGQFLGIALESAKVGEPVWIQAASNDQFRYLAQPEYMHYRPLA